jgi:hypothetical protein
MVNDENADVAATILMLLEKMPPGYRMIISKVPDIDILYRAEPIPSEEIAEILAAHRRDFDT